MANCPKCDRALPTVDGEPIIVQTGLNRREGMIYSCPFCVVILSVQIDPIVIKSDIIEEVVDRVRGLLEPLRKNPRLSRMG